MKLYDRIFLLALFFLITNISILFAQVNQNRIFDDHVPVLVKPANHDPNFIKSTQMSFYQRKSDWQAIIDSTWGPGVPLNEKLTIFNTFTQALTANFDGFNALDIDQAKWEQIVQSYRSRITDSTSRGAFSSLISHLACSLQDAHTDAYDNGVTNTPLNPGTPLLLIGCEEIEHFGAVLTLLPDSSLVVLRTVENHPLGLQPGDIVLGYEGVAWKDLVNELLEADIPLVFFQRSKKSAVRDNEMISAGMNWHLFDTIDIVKYTSGDTVHLSVSPLLDLPVPTGAIWGKFGENLMWNNEQLPVQGVPFLDPDDLDERCLTYGIVEGTNIGYIYLYIEFWEGYEGIDYNFNQQFNEAVISLQETEGLIIDLRLNWGGGVESWDAFSILFNQDLYTVVPAYRCSPTGFNLCQEISLKEESGNKPSRL